jgi:hypothetical protein
MDKLFPFDWYWLADDGRLYSSVEQSLVSASGSAYGNWRAEGRTPTRWPEDDNREQTESSLLAVIGAYSLVIGESAIDVARKRRTADLSVECEKAILAGFKSSALGVEHTYPSDIKAQINLMGSVTDSLMPNLPADWSTPFWVCDDQGNWKWEAHTASQIQQAGRDGKAAVVAAQTKLGELTAAVEAAKTKKAVEAIAW